MRRGFPGISRRLVAAGGVAGTADISRQLVGAGRYVSAVGRSRRTGLLWKKPCGSDVDFDPFVIRAGCGSEGEDGLSHLFRPFGVRSGHITKDTHFS